MSFSSDFKICVKGSPQYFISIFNPLIETVFIYLVCAQMKPLADAAENRPQ